MEGEIMLCVAMNKGDETNGNAIPLGYEDEGYACSSLRALKSQMGRWDYPLAYSVFGVDCNGNIVYELIVNGDNEKEEDK